MLRPQLPGQKALPGRGERPLPVAVALPPGPGQCVCSGAASGFGHVGLDSVLADPASATRDKPPRPRACLSCAGNPAGTG